jgi:carbonic anhydrase/acetyltransferase-like protein (isoleucine patch superfamily)
VNTLRRLSAVGFLASYRLLVRAWTKTFSVLSGAAFAQFGAGSMLQTPIRLEGEARISVGKGVFVGAGSWLQVLGDERGPVAIELGDGTALAGGCVISAAAGVRLGRRVLIARNVYIADHGHAFEDTARPVIEQGIVAVRPVEIAEGAWLGENVVVGPGVRIGRGSVVGANAVVLDDVPDHSVAVGVPARVVRTFAQNPEPVA